MITNMRLACWFGPESPPCPRVDIIGVPDWARVERYDIAGQGQPVRVATTNEPCGVPCLLNRMSSSPTEEQRERDAFALVPGVPMDTRAATDPFDSRLASAPTFSSAPRAAPDGAGFFRSAARSAGWSTVASGSATMDSTRSVLSGQATARLEDRTGLAGDTHSRWTSHVYG